ncbi:MAG: hypothetical protein Q8907_00165 [Bacteroidota bacterium]|nr:hypothetical protein [Bacteroidota bacterium]
MMRKIIPILTFLTFIYARTVGQEVSQNTSPVLKIYSSTWHYWLFDESSTYTCTNGKFEFETYYDPANVQSGYILSFDDFELYDNLVGIGMGQSLASSAYSTTQSTLCSVEDLFPNYNWSGFTSPKVFYVVIFYTTYYKNANTYSTVAPWQNIMVVARTFYPKPKVGSVSVVTNGTSVTTKQIEYNTTPGEFNGMEATGSDGIFSYQWQEKTPGDVYKSIYGATSYNYTPSRLLTSTIFRRMDSPRKCGTSMFTNEITINVLPDVSGGTIGTSQSICNYANLNLSNISSGSGGTGVYTYQWQSSKDGIYFQDIPSANGLTYSVGGLTASTYYKRICTSGVNSAESNMVAIKVYDALTSGTLSSSQTLCYNTTPAQLVGVSPAGGDGTYTYQWQSSNDGTNWSNISGAVGSNYQPGTLNESVFYRRVATSGSGCGSVISSPVTITVYDALTSGSISSSQTICNGITPSQLLGTLPTGGDGIYGYQWQSSLDNSSWSDIIGATSSGYQPEALTKTTYYHRIVTSGSGCGSKTSLPVTITVYDPLTSGTISTSQTVCNGTIPAKLAGTSPTGGSGTYTYQWQSSTDATSWSNIAMASSADYQPGALTATTYYQRVTTAGSCGSMTSSPVTITVYGALNAGTISSSQILCNGSTPSQLVGTGATGGDGKYSYQWQSSTDNSKWSDIAGSVNASYQPDALIATAYYRRVASTGCGSITSSPVKITVYDALTSGSISSSQTICNGIPPSQILGTLPTGGDGVYSYQWQKSTDNDTWSDIFGATSASYQPEPLKTTTYYHRIVTSGSGCGSKTSLRVTITVYGALTSGTISTSQTVCNGAIPAKLSGTSPTGGSGTYTYQWQSSLNATSWSNIAMASSADYQPGALTATTYYQRVTTSGSCGSVTSSPVTITVYGALNAGTVSSSQILCNGSIPSQLFGTSPTGGDGKYTYQWQSSTDNNKWSDIAGSVNASYQPDALISTTYYRRVANTGCGSITSSPVKIIVYDVLTSGSISSSQTICNGITPSQLLGTSPTGGDGVYGYQWQKSTDNDTWSDIFGATSASYQPEALTATTYYHRVATSGSGCGSKTSLPVTITVYGTLTSGTISTSQTVCNGAIPTKLVGTSPTGGNGTYTYQWQSSLDATSWYNIAMASSADYQPGALTATTYYQRVTTAGSCGSMSSSPVTITVYGALNAGILSQAQTLCYNGTPAQIVCTSPTGGDGKYTYQWESSLDNSKWLTIAGALSANYQSGVLTATTYFRRITTSGSGCGSKTSSPATITVYGKLDPGEIYNSQVICSSSIPAGLTGTSASGGDGIFNYQWKYSVNGSIWNNIPGASTSSYIPTSLTQTTYYKRVVTNNCGTATSDSLKIEVKGIIDPGVIGQAQTICYNTSPQLLSGNVASGGFNNFTYQWQLAYDNSIYTDITLANGASFQSGNITGTSYFRRKVTDSNCGSAYTSPVLISVMPALPLPAVSYNSIYCRGSNLNLSAGSDFSYGWYDANKNLLQTGSNYSVQNIQNDQILYIIAKNNQNCLSDAQQVNLNVDKIKAGFTTERDSFAIGEQVKYSNASSGATSYLWKLENYSYTDKDIYFNYYSPGDKTVQLIATSANNCMDSYLNAKAVTIYDPLKSAITENTIRPKIRIYPTAVNDVLNIETSLDMKEVEFINSIGLTVKKLMINSGEYHGNLFDFKPGLYLIKITLKDNSFQISKIIKL